MSENSPLSLNLYFSLRHTYYHVRKDLRIKLKKQEDITWAQFHTLYHLDEEGVSFNKLADKIHCNASNMTGLIDRMKKNGWVYRERSEDDRRVWLVKLTSDGAKLREKLIPKHRNNIKDRMNLLSKEEQKTLKKLLEKLIKE